MEVGCIQIPHFPAWTLRRHGAASPFLVVDAGRAVAACPTARSAGVRPDVPVARAQSACPEAVLRTRDPALEAAAWERVLVRLNITTPHVEADAPGRAFVRPHNLDALRAAVAALGATAACAPARGIARLAAGTARPGELLRIAPDHADAFLHRLPVEHLAGAGFDADRAEQLALFGYDTVGAVRTLSKRHLTAQFGEAGARLHAFLHATHDAPVAAFTPPPSVNAKHCFEHPQREPGPLQHALAALADRAATALDGRTAQRVTVTLSVQGADPLVAARTLREAQSTARPLTTVAHTLLRNALAEPVPVDAVCLSLGALAAPDTRQGSLFFERPAVRAAIQAVHRRHPGALQRAQVHPHAVFAEDAVRFVPIKGGGTE